MKLLIASDIHGYPEYCEKLMDAFDTLQPDKLVLLGDILDSTGGGEVADMLNERAEHIIAVCGNCDTDDDQAFLRFPMLAPYRLVDTGTRMLFATHGHEYNMHHCPGLPPCGLLLTGHTHVPAWMPFGSNNLYCNPGSVSLPRRGSSRGYMVLTDDQAQWFTLGGEPVYTHVF